MDLDNQLNGKSNLISFRGKIDSLYNNCPKANGWFGCFFLPDGAKNTIRITGNYPVYQLSDLKVGNRFEILVQPSVNTKYTDYDIQYISLVPSPKHLRRILLDIKGIGKVAADKIINALGDDAYNIIRNATDSEKRLPIEQRLISAGLSKNQIVSVIGTIQSGGASNSPYRMKLLSLGDVLPQNMFNKWAKVVDNLIQAVISPGNMDKSLQITDAMDLVIKKIYNKVLNEPYLLCLQFADVLPFTLMDMMTMAKGHSAFDQNRILSAIKYVLNVQYKRYTFVDLNTEYVKFINDIVTLLNKTDAGKTDAVFVSNIFNNMTDADMEDYEFVIEDYALYDLTKYRNEVSAAYSVARLLKSSTLYSFDVADINDVIDEFDVKEGRQLDSYQREAVIMVLTNRLSIITGGPGRGKSSVVKCIIYCWETLTGSDKKVQLCAPTGKACNRLCEATGRTNAKTAAKYDVTYSWASHAKKAPEAVSFMNDINRNLVIIDESTMLGLGVASHLLTIFRECQIVFLGDVDQLPSIEYGQFFKDLYDCDDVPTTKLMVNHRASVNIIAGADSINAGLNILNAPLTVDDEFSFYDCNMDGVYAANTIVNKYCQLVSDANVSVQQDNMTETCILAPMKKREDGVTMLNVNIQGLLNPTGRPVELLAYYNNDIKVIPRIGDRVIFITNLADADYKYVKGPRNGQRGEGISNGDCGFLVSCNKSIVNGDSEYTITLVLDDGRRYDFTPKECKGSIELAYAMTIHKSQGSEYQNVILAVQSGLNFTQGDFANRNLVYTAVTRAKSKCMMVGSINAMNRCISTPMQPRNSRLIQRITDALLNVHPYVFVSASYASSEFGNDLDDNNNNSNDD